MNKNRIFLSIAFIISLSVILIAPFLGAVKITLKGLTDNNTLRIIFFNLRVPRVFLSFFAGAMLSVSGLILQSVFRNPLVSPYTLGVSSAASAGVFFSIKTGIFFSFFSILTSYNIFSIIFSLFSVFFLYFLSKISGDFNLKTALLAGISLNFLFSSFIMILHFISSPQESFEIFKWIFGSLETEGYSIVIIFLFLFIILFALSFYYRRELDLFSLSEEIALSKGVDVEKFKISVFLLLSIIIAIIVSYTGPIGFIGLIIPHIAKKLGGGKHSVIVPLSAYLGGFLLVFSDIFSRIVVPPAEIPVGIITTLFGVPFFIYLIWKNR
jgi:iron complex transport system permease protein